MKLLKYLGIVLLFLFSLMSVNAAGLNESIEAYYKFDGDVLDATGLGNNGINQGSTNATGKINDARRFDGSSQYIDVSAVTIGSGDFTINAWVNPDTISQSTIFQSRTGTAGGYISMYLEVGTDKLTFDSYDGSIQAQLKSTNTIPTGSWSMVSVTFNRTANQGELFINGSSEGTFSLGSIGSLVFTTQNVGKRNTGAGTYFDGTIDEMGIWTEAKNTDEIVELYNNNEGLQYPFVIPPILPIINFQEVKLANVTNFNDTWYNSTPQLLEVTLNTTDTNNNTNVTLYMYNSTNDLITTNQFITNNLTGSYNISFPYEGIFKISLYAENNETSTTYANQTIKYDGTAPNISIIGSLNQNDFLVNFSEIFNVTDALSGLSSCTINITYLENITNASQYDQFVNCTDTTTFGAAGLYNGFIEAYDNAGNLATLSVNGTIEPFVYINFLQINGSNIDNYDATLFYPNGFTESFVGIDNPINISPFSNDSLILGTYNISFAKLGYITQTVSVEINETSGGEIYNFTITDAEIIITIRDRETGSIVSGPLFQLEFIATVGLVSNTTTGTKTITNTFFQNESYQLVVSGTNYTTESLFFDFTNQESLALTVYVTDTNDLQYGVVEVKVVDKFGKSIVGAIGQALQWNSNTSSYVKVSEGLTAEDGKTILNIILDTKQYIFRASFEDLQKNTTPQFIPTLLNGKLIVISLDEGPTEFEAFLENVQYTIDETFDEDNSISNITFDWETTDGTDIQGCIYYYRVQPSGTTTELSEDCSTGSDVILMVSKNLNSSYYIEARVGFVVGGLFYNQQTFTYPPVFDISNILQETNLALFILPLLYLVVVLIGMANVFIGAILLIVVNGLGLWLVPQYINGVIVAVFYFIGLALMFGGAKRK